MIKNKNNNSGSNANKRKLTQRERIIKQCKTFVLSVIFPLLLKKSMVIYYDNRQRYSSRVHDMLLMGMLTVFGMCFPTVRLAYGTDMFSLNISIIINGGSGSNKSLIKYCIRLLKKIDAEIISRFKTDHKDWEEKEEVWQAYLKKYKGKDEELDFSLKPGEEPKYSCLIVPGNVSKSMLTDLLKANEKYGSIIYTSETDSINDANSKEYGKMDDTLNKAIVNETVDKAFRVDGTKESVEFPMTSVLSSGTDNQNHRLLPSYENGAGSRMPVLQVVSDDEFKSQRPAASLKNYHEVYDALGDEVLEMWKFFLDYQFIITFNDNCWDEHDATWGKYYSDIKEDNDDLTSVALRLASYQLRIAGILSMLRLWDMVKADRDAFEARFPDKGKTYPLLCSDEDFEASRNIATTILEHTMSFASTIEPRTPSGIKEMEPWKWHHKLLEDMPPVFPSSLFLEKAQASPYNKSEKTAYAKLNEMRKAKIIRRKKERLGGEIIYAKGKDA